MPESDKCCCFQKQTYSQRHVPQSWPVPGPHKQTDAKDKDSKTTSLIQHVFRETLILVRT